MKQLQPTTVVKVKHASVSLVSSRAIVCRSEYTSTLLQGLPCLEKSCQQQYAECNTYRRVNNAISEINLSSITNLSLNGQCTLYFTALDCDGPTGWTLTTIHLSHHLPSIEQVTESRAVSFVKMFLTNGGANQSRYVQGHSQKRAATRFGLPHFPQAGEVLKPK